jgi:hypothetical protein
VSGTTSAEGTENQWVVGFGADEKTLRWKSTYVGADGCGLQRLSRDFNLL